MSADPADNATAEEEQRAADLLGRKRPRYLGRTAWLKLKK